MQHPVYSGTVSQPAGIARLAAGRGRRNRRTDVLGTRLLDLVGSARGVPVPMLTHRSRCRAEVALARQLAMYLMHVSLQRQYAEVGRFFGRDRTTVWHACGLIEDLREDRGFDAEVEALEQAVEAMRDAGEAYDVAC